MGEAFARLGMNTFMTIYSKCLPLHYAANTAIIGIFQKTKVLQSSTLFPITITEAKS